MELVLEWFRANNDVFGFIVGAIIFFIAIALVSRKAIGFLITLLLLLFALFSGLIIANQGFFKDWRSNRQTEKHQNVVEEASEVTE